MGDIHIPAIRTMLEETAASGTRNPEVYLALTKIYSEDVRQIEEAVRLGAQNASPPVPLPIVLEAPAETAALWRPYAQGEDAHVRYQLLTASNSQPDVRSLVAPFYPSELLDQKLAGEVVLDLQVTEEGKVGGVWLVSAVPEVFANLATSSVRQWRFEPAPAKIRIVLQFRP